MNDSGFRTAAFRTAASITLLTALSLASVRFAKAQDQLDVIWQQQAGSAIAFSSDGEQLVTANDLRSAADGTLLAHYAIHPIGNGVGAAAISPDGTYVALGIQSFNQNLDVFDAATGAIVHTRITAHNNGTTAVAFAPDGQTLASGGRDGTAKLWSLPDVSLIRTLGSTSGYNPRVFAIAFSPDGLSLAVGGQGGVQVFAVADGTVLQTLTDVSTLSLAYSPDGEILASGSDVIDQQGQCTDCTIKLFDTSDGTLLRTIDSDNGGNGIGTLAFSPDGTVLAAGSGDHIFDGIVQLLRVADGALIDSFEQAGAYVTDVAYSPDGNLFALARSDATVIVAHNPAPGAGDGCDYALVPASLAFPASGGNGKIDVTTEAGCAWQATSSATWVHVASSIDSDDGSISYSVDANAGAARNATITVAGRTHTVQQRGGAFTGRAR